MNMDKFTITIIGTTLILMAVFLGINYDTLVYATNMVSLNIGPVLMFLCIIGVSMSTLNFRGDKRAIVMGVFLPVIFLIFAMVYNSPLALSISNIHLQTPIEEIPIDFGLTGFVLILINGFLLSHVLIRKDVDTTERLLLSIGLGFGTTSLIMILLGILWEISVLTIILPQAILLITTLIVVLHKGFELNLKKHLNFLSKTRGNITTTNLIEVIIIIMIGIYTIIAVYQVIAYPAVEWDSLAYGVNYAKVIFENKKVPLIAGPSIGLEMSANYPPGVPLLAVYFYTLAGNVNDFYFRILQPIFGLAVMLTTYKLTITVTKSKIASLFAIFLLSVIPLYWDRFIQDSYFMGLTLMLTLSAYFFFRAYNSNDSETGKYEAIGVLFCGFSALISYIGILSLGIILLYALNKRLHAKRAIGLTALALCIMLPWFTRNLILLRNPVYPFFGFGNYLDPLLESSTTQHFENWLKDPLMEWISITCKLGIIVLLLTIAYLTFIKQKNFFTILSLFLFFCGISIMAFHVPFSRYLVIGVPALSAIFAVTIMSSFAKHDLLDKTIAIILISLISLSSLSVLPYLNTIKPISFASDKWNYLSQIYEDADAWKWINENTPQNAGIATYDIREYYIERSVMALDGYSAEPIYKMNTIEEAISYLQLHNITYVLSVDWASPLNDRMPPAYEWCILTRYLGDPRYLPPVYVGSKGSAVYHVGPIEEKAVYASFSQEGFAPPIKQVKINLTITNETSPPSGKFYIPIPVDYSEGLMMTSVNSCTHSVNVELWNGIVPENMSTDQLEKSELVKQWPSQSTNKSSVENPSFVWQVDRSGYFTFLIADQEKAFKGIFNVTMDIRFYNYWDKNQLFVNEGSTIYDVSTSSETFPLMKTLYIQADEPAVLSINSTTFGKKISLEIFKEFLPIDAVMNWSAQYEILTRQPSLNETSGAVNPSIQNMFISYGEYSILIVDRDSSATQESALVEVKFTSLG